MLYSSVSLLLGFSAMLSVSLVSLLLEVCTIICLGVKRHLVSGHEISRLIQHGLQSIMARCTRIINRRPFCNLYEVSDRLAILVTVATRTDAH